MSKTDINGALPNSPGRKVTLVLAVLGALGTIVLQSYISGILNPVSMQHFLTMQFSWNVSAFNTNLAALGAGRQAYVSHLWYDLFFPMVYVTFLICTLWLAMTPKPRGFNLLPPFRRAWALERFRRLRAARSLAFLPMVAGVADLAENGLTLYLLDPSSQLNDAMVMVAFCCTLVKWTFLTWSVSVGIYALVVQWLAKHKRTA